MRWPRGFTLLEVLCALVILGGLLVTLVYTINHHMDIALRHEALTVGEMLGRAKLDELKQSPGASSGEFPPPFEGYTYRAEVLASSYPGISEARVTVEAARERIVVRELIRGAYQ